LERHGETITVFRGANPFDQLSAGVKGLLIANTAVFFLQLLAPNIFMDYLALRPILIIKKYWVWQLVTYAFIHGNFFHLFVNMFALWMFAPHIEYLWGTKVFIRYYFLCVVGAALTQMAVAPYDLVIGASGGIYGLLLAFGFLFPDSVIYLFFVFPLRAIQAVLLIAFISLYSALSAGKSPVANMAHLGGMFTGFLYFKLPLWFENLGRWRRHHRFLSSSKLIIHDGAGPTKGDRVEEVDFRQRREQPDHGRARNHAPLCRKEKVDGWWD
jgi:membrane associated rhomboid family serine protease